MPDVRSDSKIEAAPTDGGLDGAVGGPMLILRPRLVYRILGPLLLTCGVLGAAAGTMPALVLAVIGLALLPTLLPRITVNDREITILT